MKVLIVDDEPTSRLLLARIVAREFGLSVVEAADGREALDQLERQEFGFILLDLLMPTMDGVETLTAIRESESERLKQLPVVILSAVKDETAIRTILRLGVSDYLAKPLHPQNIVTRLTRFMQTIPAVENPSAEDSAGAVHAAAAGATGSGEPRVEIIVADGDAQYRAFVRGLLGSEYRIIEAETGARALRRCQESRPAMLLLGEELGAVERPLLARKIRGTPELRDVRLIAAVPAARRDALRQDKLYDGVVARTLSNQVFLDDFAQIRPLAPTDGAGEQLVAGVRLRLVQTVEQVFGMMLGVEMRLQTEIPQVSGTWVQAEIDLTLVHENFTLAVVCACPATTGTLLAGKVRRVSSDWIGGDPAAAALGDIASIITERLQQALVEQGRKVTSVLAAVRREPPRAREDALLTLVFDAQDGGLPFRVMVGGRAKDAGATLTAMGVGR
jgi:CheY-like chemotaxis protein